VDCHGARKRLQKRLLTSNGGKAKALITTGPGEKTESPKARGKANARPNTIQRSTREENTHRRAKENFLGKKQLAPAAFVKCWIRPE
jgi:hypothetical protein